MSVVSLSCFSACPLLVTWPSKTITAGCPTPNVPPSSCTNVTGTVASGLTVAMVPVIGVAVPAVSVAVPVKV